MKMLKKADTVLIIAFLALAVVMLFAELIPKESGGVKIMHDGVSDIYPLNENRDISVTSNGYKLTVSISDGTVYVKSADCPDKVCQRTGKINGSGSIVCIPAKVTVEFTDDINENDAFVG